MTNKENPIQIVLTGPESTGKSTLSEQLSTYYSVPFVKEYSRDYLNKTNGVYFESDLVKIAKEQAELKLNAQKLNSKLIILDTEFLVLYIWSMYKYGKVDSFIESQLINSPADLYLLCDIDLEWEYDSLRENKKLIERKLLFQLYKAELIKRNFNYRIISGQNSARLKNAVKEIDLFF